jgi:hypothetical protein
MRIFKALAAGTALVMALPLSASAAQLDADEAPTTKGPVATSPQLKSCQSKSFKQGNKTVAHFKVCSRYYLFNPEAETDSTKDYGAFWIQVNADAVPGFCVKTVRTRLAFSQGVHSKAPRPGTVVQTKRKRRYTTKLTVDAQGNTDTVGVIKNSFVIHPGRMRARLVDGDTYRLKWRGSSGGKLGFAGGLELSWATGEEAPDVDPQIVARMSEDC